MRRDLAACTVWCGACGICLSAWGRGFGEGIQAFSQAHSIEVGERRGIQFNDNRATPKRILTQHLMPHCNQACLGTVFRLGSGAAAASQGVKSAPRPGTIITTTSSPSLITHPSTPPNTQAPPAGNQTKQASASTTAMIYSLIKRIPGSQGTKVCRQMSSTSTWTMGACVASCGGLVRRTKAH